MINHGLEWDKCVC